MLVKIHLINVRYVVFQKKISLNNKKYAIITDSLVGPIYADSVKDTIAEIASEVAVFTFKAGEASKNLDTINEIYDFLLENNGEVLVFLDCSLISSQYIVFIFSNKSHILYRTSFCTKYLSFFL